MLLLKAFWVHEPEIKPLVLSSIYSEQATGKRFDFEFDSNNVAWLKPHPEHGMKLVFCENGFHACVFRSHVEAFYDLQCKNVVLAVIEVPNGVEMLFDLWTGKVCFSTFRLLRLVDDYNTLPETALGLDLYKHPADYRTRYFFYSGMTNKSRNFPSSECLFRTWTVGTKFIIRKNGEPNVIVSGFKERREEWRQTDGSFSSTTRPSIIIYDEYVTDYWFKDGELHRDGGLPACIARNRDGTVVYRAWYIHGKVCRPNKPAMITYDSKGEIIREDWYNDCGQLHRGDDLPAITKWDSDRNITYLAWRYEGKASRKKGPATIAWEITSKGPVLCYMYWQWKDRYHNFDQKKPSIINWDAEGNVSEQFWCKHGSYVFKREIVGKKWKRWKYTSFSRAPGWWFRMRSTLRLTV